MTYLKKIIKMARTHKILASLVILGLIFSVYRISSRNGVEIRYAAASVEKGTLITAIQGSGQVSALNQIDIKPRASGEVIYVGAQAGQKVWTGSLIAQLDASDAKIALENAQISLETAQIQLEKLKLNQVDGADQIAINTENAENNLAKAYEDGFSNISNTFLDSPSIMTSFLDIKNGKGLDPNGGESYSYENMVNRRYITDLSIYIYAANTDYEAARSAHENNLTKFKNTRRDADPEVIIDLIDKTLNMVRLMSQTAQSERNLLDRVADSIVRYGHGNIPAQLSAYQNDLASYMSRLNSHISSLLNVQNTIINNVQNVKDAGRSLELAELSDPLDIRTQENNVRQRKAAVASAQKNLNNRYVVAPFAGTLASVDISRGDNVSSSTTVATIITDQKIAELTLNEIDIVQVEMGQKATLTFDAVEDLTISGKVVQVDLLGSVMQGVVSYGVRIALDTEDERIRPGMTANSDIITNVSQNALMVPNSAIKYQGDIAYVEVITSSIDTQTASLLDLTTTDIERVEITIGNSNEAYSEVLAGLEEGQAIVTQTMNSDISATSDTVRPGSGGMPGFGGGGTMYVH